MTYLLAVAWPHILQIRCRSSWSKIATRTWQTKHQQSPLVQRILWQLWNEEEHIDKESIYKFYVKCIVNLSTGYNLYLNAGERMEAKLSSCPMQTTSSAGWLELELELSLLWDRTVQKRHRPKCPGLLEVDVSPTHSSWRNTTIFRIAEHTVNTPHNIPTDFECWKDQNIFQNI